MLEGGGEGGEGGGGGGHKEESETQETRDQGRSHARKGRLVQSGGWVGKYQECVIIIFIAIIHHPFGQLSSN